MKNTDYFQISKDGLSSFLNQLSDHIFIAQPVDDGEFKILAGNAAMLRFFGKSPDEVVGKTISEVLNYTPGAKRINETYQQVIESGEAIVYEEDSGDTEFRYEVFETSLFRFEAEGEEGYLIGGISRNISFRKSIQESLESSRRSLESKVRELELVQRKLEEESIRDPLTSLLNRRHLDEFLNHEMARARRQNQPLTIMMIDLDHFKQLNDNYGHQTGDIVLRNLGYFFRQNRRGSDIMFRYGGDEFLFILPETDLKDTKLLCAQLKTQLQREVLQAEDPALDVTLSIGLATYPEHGASSYELVKAADTALYEAKRRGRDITMVFGEQT
ncbi:MAG: sensor domain-containing diguanylate cyclase [Idiomarina sp.]|nr:sensor domain-containing diguanylate cyclase [Idiomarina sp.]